MQNTRTSRRQLRNRHQKKLPYFKWWFWLIILFILISGGFGIKSYINYRHQSAPYYNQIGAKVLYSNNVDKLNKDQEEQFYSIARGAIHGEQKDIDFDNINDEGLYVKKLKNKHTYHIEYICSINLYDSMNFKTKFDVELKKKSLKSPIKFKYYNFKSNLTDLMEAFG